MSIKTTLLAFAGGIYAAKLYQKSIAGAGAGPSTGRSTADSSAGSDGASTGSSVDASDSPNAGERLRQEMSDGSPLAESPGLAQALDEGNVFEQRTTPGTGSPVPGLPDFARGS